MEQQSTLSTEAVSAQADLPPQDLTIADRVQIAVLNEELRNSRSTWEDERQVLLARLAAGKNELLDCREAARLEKVAMRGEIDSLRQRLTEQQVRKGGEANNATQCSEGDGEASGLGKVGADCSDDKEDTTARDELERKPSEDVEEAVVVHSRNGSENEEAVGGTGLEGRPGSNTNSDGCRSARSSVKDDDACGVVEESIGGGTAGEEKEKEVLPALIKLDVGVQVGWDHALGCLLEDHGTELGSVVEAVGAAAGRVASDSIGSTTRRSGASCRGTTPITTASEAAMANFSHDKERIAELERLYDFACKQKQTAEVSRDAALHTKNDVVNQKNALFEKLLVAQEDVKASVRARTVAERESARLQQQLSEAELQVQILQDEAAHVRQPSPSPAKTKLCSMEGSKWSASCAKSTEERLLIDVIGRCSTFPAHSRAALSVPLAAIPLRAGVCSFLLKLLQNSQCLFF